MAIRKTLTKIVLAPILAGAIALSGCSKDPQQIYKGKIGHDYVVFEGERIGYDLIGPNIGPNIMTVKKPDGRIISYIDSWKSDLKLDYVKITKDGKTRKYWYSDEIERPVVEKAQEQFDDYLRQITELEIKKGMGNLE